MCTHNLFGSVVGIEYGCALLCEHSTNVALAGADAASDAYGFEGSGHCGNVSFPRFLARIE